MTKKHGHWGRLLESRTQQQHGGGLAKCAACRSGRHGACSNRAYDDVLGVTADCFCAYMDHGVRPSERKRLDEIAAPEPEQNAYENTIGLDR